MELRPEEIELTGKWLTNEGRVIADSTAQRIKALIEDFLEEVATDASGWDQLYRDPKDGRYWELTYPQSHMQGGGPPRLTNISIESAKRKYDIL